MLQFPLLQPLVIKLYELIIIGLGLKKKMTAYDALSSAVPQYATRYWLKDNAPKAVRELTKNGRCLRAMLTWNQKSAFDCRRLDLFLVQLVTRIMANAGAVIQASAAKSLKSFSDIPRMMVYGGRDFLLKLKYSHMLASDLGNPDPANHYTYEGKEEKKLKTLVQVLYLRQDLPSQDIHRQDDATSRAENAKRKLKKMT